MFMPSQGISLGSDTSGEDNDELPDSELQDFIVEDDDEEAGQALTSSVSVRLIETNHDHNTQGQEHDDGELPDDPLVSQKTLDKLPTRGPRRAITTSDRRKRRIIDEDSD